MNDKTRPSDLDKQREHQGDYDVSGPGNGPGAAKPATDKGTAEGQSADGSHSRHDEGDAGKRS